MRKIRSKRVLVIGILLLTVVLTYAILGTKSSLDYKLKKQLYIGGNNEKYYIEVVEKEQRKTIEQKKDLALLSPINEHLIKTSKEEDDSEEADYLEEADYGTPPNGSLLVKEIGNKASKIPQDLMALKPFPFMNNYKNPCFKDERTGIINCLPYFYLIGAPKAGTTDLFKRVTQHPQVSPNVSKEPHWLTRRRFECSKKCPTITYYFRKFRRAAEDIIRNVDPNTEYHAMIAGDFSASTIWDHDKWYYLPENRGRGKPKHMNPDFIHHLNPKAKIIAILRNPTDRLFSDYIYFHHLDHKNNNTFHSVALGMVKRYRRCFASYSLEKCLFKPEPKDLRKNARLRLRIGTYSFYLKEYYRVFPKDQILVLTSENYKKNVTETLLKIFDFLELAPVTAEKMRNISDVSKLFNANDEAKAKVGTMLPETRKILDDFYAPFNMELEKLTGIRFT